MGLLIKCVCIKLCNLQNPRFITVFPIKLGVHKPTSFETCSPMSYFLVPRNLPTYMLCSPIVEISSATSPAPNRKPRSGLGSKPQIQKERCRITVCIFVLRLFFGFGLGVKISVKASPHARVAEEISSKCQCLQSTCLLEAGSTKSG